MKFHSASISHFVLVGTTLHAECNITKRFHYFVKLHLVDAQLYVICYITFDRCTATLLATLYSYTLMMFQWRNNICLITLWHDIYMISTWYLHDIFTISICLLHYIVTLEWCHWRNNIYMISLWCDIYMISIWYLHDILKISICPLH